MRQRRRNSKAMGGAMFMRKWPRLTPDGRLGLMLALPVVLIMGGLVLLPLISTVIDSFFRIEPMKPGTPFVGFRNYATQLTDPAAQSAWAVTGAYVVLAVVIETLGGLMIALLLNRIKRGRNWLLAAAVLPWCLPPVVNAIIWAWIYNPSYGLLNGLLRAAGLTLENQVWFNNQATGLFLIALVHAWRMMPLSVIILLAALQSIPGELYEAARIDGATLWQRLRNITLPLIAPGLAIALSQSTVFAINLFDEAWILNGAATDTRPVMIQTYIAAFQNLKLSAGMALSVMAMILSVAVSGFYVLRVYRETRFE
jgi:multiple sugar transport system permease protein